MRKEDESGDDNRTGPIASLLGYLHRADSATEHDAPHDGAFSYASEWHAFIVGFAVGFASFTPIPRLGAFVYDVVGLDRTGKHPASNAMKEARKEGWYALGGVMVGTVAGLGATAALLYIGVSMFVV